MWMGSIQALKNQKFPISLQNTSSKMLNIRDYPKMKGIRKVKRIRGYKENWK